MMLSKTLLFSLYFYKTWTVTVITIMYLLMGWDPYHMANKIRNAERSTRSSEYNQYSSHFIQVTMKPNNCLSWGYERCI